NVVPVLTQREHLGAELLQSIFDPRGFFLRNRQNLRARGLQLVSLGFAEVSRKEVADARLVRGFVGDNDLLVGCILVGSAGSSLCQRRLWDRAKRKQGRADDRRNPSGKTWHYALRASRSIDIDAAS